MRVTNVVPWTQERYSRFFSMPVCRKPMPHRASVTVSPSSSRMSRSTPCVDGCCGPMFTTTRSCAPSGGGVTLSQSPPDSVKTRPSVVS